MPTNTTGEITIGRLKANGLCTVTYPSGQTKEWRKATVEARGYEVPTRQTFRVTDDATGEASRFCEIFAGDLEDGDTFNVNGEDVAATDVSKSGRDVTFRLNGFRRKASVYRRVTIVRV